MITVYRHDNRRWKSHIDDVLHAIALHKQTRLNFWDAMIVHAAAEPGCDVLDGRSERRSADQRSQNPQSIRWCPGRVIRGVNAGARRPDGKARRVRILGIFERGVTQPAGMPRPAVMLRITRPGH